ncbi:cyclase family protein [Photobacterium swingsii]|uniref:cyclase family protein n=1 Tax=Photobacterium swingsii TaxID=680026 RepID=UPI003D1165D8
MTRTDLHSKNISLEINEEHPAYQWAKAQADSVNAMGHIGTHIDCYTKVPLATNYQTDVHILDCSDAMPTIDQIEGLELDGKSLVLYTGNFEKNGYGNPNYGAQSTVLDSDVLDAILKQAPQFIVIDSYGIGAHGDEHISFDKRCEEHNCFVIENVCLTQAMLSSIVSLDIRFDPTSASTGKRCDVTVLSHTKLDK